MSLRARHRPLPPVAPRCVALAALLTCALGLPATSDADEPDSSGTTDETWGEEAGDWGAGAGDFAESPPPPPPAALPAAATPSAWSAKGFVRSDQALWAERLRDDRFAKSRQSFDLQLNYKQGIWRAMAATHLEHDLAYSLYRDDYDLYTLHAYESLFQLREAWVAAALGAFEVTVGRQIVAWGEGDAISPLDVVNPRDLREPGLADLDDIRIPVLASRLGWFKGSHRVEAMVVHEADFGLRGPPRGPFSPLPWLIEDQLGGSPEAKALKAGGIDVVERFDAIPLDFAHKQDRFDLALQQAYLRWVYKGPGIDLGLYAASVLDQQGVMVFSAEQQTDMMGKVLQGSTEPMALTLDHRRYEVLGTSGAWAYGSWLAKWEVGFERRHPYNAGTFPKVEVARSDVVSAMLGVSYTGIEDTTLAIEGSKATLLDKPDGLLFPIDQPMIMARAMHQALRGDLTLLAAGSMMGLTAQYGWLARAEASYKLIEALKLTLGYITYQPTDRLGPFAGLSEHDRLFLRLRWDFAAR